MVARTHLARDISVKGTWQIYQDASWEAQGIVRSPDGDFWVANTGPYPSLVRFSPRGQEHSISIQWGPEEIAASRNGKLFFTNGRFLSVILRFDPKTGQTSEVSLNDDTNGGITLGADGNIWVVELSHIAKVSPGGRLLMEYSLPCQTEGASGITWADGKVWFLGGKGIASLSPASGKVATYEAPTCCGGGLVHESGSLFVAASSGTLMRFDVETKSVTTYKSPRRFLTAPEAANVTVAPDGSVWYAAQRTHNGRVVGGGFVRFDVKSKRFMTYPSPDRLPWNEDVASGPDGRIWGTAGYAVTVLNPKR
jgi:streptogramin lyase